MRMEDERIPKKVLDGKLKTSWKTKNKMGGHHLKRHITDPRRVEETSRRYSKEASSEEVWGPEEAVAP